MLFYLNARENKDYFYWLLYIILLLYVIYVIIRRKRRILYNRAGRPMCFMGDKLKNAYVQKRDERFSIYGDVLLLYVPTSPVATHQYTGCDTNI